jgi:hypothetical protein
MPPGPRRSIGSCLQTGDQKQVHNLKRAIRQPDYDRSTRRRYRQDLRVVDREGPAIGQVNVKGLERPGLVHSADLFDGHRNILPAAKPGRQRS